MESVFGRRKKEKTKDGQICPLCTLENPLDVESCSRCYYDFTVGTHQQSRSSDENAVSSILNELNSELSDSEEEGIDVDWTSHTFDMSDLSVEVADYGDSDDVTISSKVGFARQLVSNEEVGNEEDEEEYILTSDDAPSKVEKFVVPEGEEEDISIPEPTRIAIVDPVSKEGQGLDEDLLTEDWSESDTAPVLSQNRIDEVEKSPKTSATNSMPTMPQMPTTLSMDSGTVNAPVTQPQVVQAPPPVDEPKPVTAPPPEAFTSAASTDLPTLPGVVQNTQSTPQTSMPTLPTVPATAPQPTAQITPASPPMPNLPTTPTTTPQPVSTNPSSLWPWPQVEPWDDRLLASKVKNAMEAAKMNRKEEAAAILDEIGPHLGDRTRLILYIGALLKSLGRSDALLSMLEIARKDYANDEHVIAALKQLS